uniref:EIF3h C-terminal domain-containing protein n=1 Tax=Ditylenchus dipsaci TaxID=166011 RepID=A0A915DKZ9_9BILA
MEKIKYDISYNALAQKRQQENEQRAARGEPLLSLDDIKKQLKYPQLQAKNGMLELFLNARDTDAYAEYASTVTGQNIAKLFLSEAISSGSADKERGNSTSRA